MFNKGSCCVGLQKSLPAEVLPVPTAGVAGPDIQISNCSMLEDLWEEQRMCRAPCWGCCSLSEGDVGSESTPSLHKSQTASVGHFTLRCSRWALPGQDLELLNQGIPSFGAFPSLGVEYPSPEDPWSAGGLSPRAAPCLQ